MLRLLVLLAIVFILSSCNTDELEPVASLCTEGMINVVHTQIDTIQDYTLADEYEEGVYRITSDEEFAAFFNEAPPAINYDSLTLLVAVVDAGDYTFTESITTSYDCEGQKLNLNLSLYNYDENVDTLKYWRHVVLAKKYIHRVVFLNINPISCFSNVSLTYKPLASDTTLLVSDGQHYLINNELLYGFRPICSQVVEADMIFIANNEEELKFKSKKYNKALCTSIDFQKFADFSDGSLVAYTTYGSASLYEDYDLSYNCQQNELIITPINAMGADFLEGYVQGFIFPLEEFISSEVRIR